MDEGMNTYRPEMSAAVKKRRYSKVMRVAMDRMQFHRSHFLWVDTAWQLFKFKCDGVCLVFYPHKSTAGNRHVRVRDENSTNRGLAETLMRRSGFSFKKSPAPKKQYQKKPSRKLPPPVREEYSGKQLASQSGVRKSVYRPDEIFIAKVQVSTDRHTVLIYDKHRIVMVEFPMDESFEDMMQGRRKAFFYCCVDERGVLHQNVLEDEPPKQNW